MYRILSASKDCYITDKIVRNSFRATDANVGQAGTLDLFKLYNESSHPTLGSKNLYELSRILVKFDISEIKKMHNDGLIDVGGESFKSHIHLHDVYGGQTTPNNFNAIVFPLAKHFDEGNGYDIVEFKDVGVTNWLTASQPSVSQPQKSTGTLTIANGSSASGASEKQSITLTSADGITKKYVIVDDNATLVATGDILAEGSDFGSGVLSATDSAISGIAVAINLTGGSVSTQNALLVQLRNAILHANGHDGKITVSTTATDSNADGVPDQTSSSQSITLTQSSTGYSGNSIIDSDITNLTFSGFINGTGGYQAWHLPGAMKSGSLGDANIDVIVSGTFEGQHTISTICAEQYFASGEEDLKIDITAAVSASVKELMDDHGFLVAFSGSHEIDANSYFVKRFASRNTANTTLRPKLSIQYDDTILDNHGNFVFDLSGSLFLNNFYRGAAANITQADYSDIPATNSIILKIRSGSFTKNLDVSQAMRGDNRLKGVYSASFAMSSYNALAAAALKTNNNLSYDAIWSSADETITYLSSSLVVKKNRRTSLNYRENRYLATTLNLKDRYKATDNVKIRLFIENVDRNVVFTKGPIDKPSEIFENVYYSVKDFVSGKVLIPFDTVGNSTRLSTDSIGMHYDFYMSSLPRGRTYIFEYLVKQNGIDTYITDAASKFIVE